MHSKIDMRMKVSKYVPSGLYGFLSDDSQKDVFFHLSAFDPGAYVGDAPVPPIVGETLEVTTTDGKVVQCERLETPVGVRGEINWFSEEKGYGFITGDDNESYYLHKTEILDGRLPLKGRRVSFFVTKQERVPLRACYVSIEM